MSLKKEKYVLVKFKLAVYIFFKTKQTSRNETKTNAFCREIFDGQDI